MTAMAPQQRFLFFCFLLWTAVAPMALADPQGDPCGIAYPGWNYAGGAVQLDDDCDFSVDFNTSGDPFGWVSKPVATLPGPTSTYSFLIGTEFPNLVPETGFRVFDLKSEKVEVFELVIYQGHERGLRLRGAWYDNGWHAMYGAGAVIDPEVAQAQTVMVVIDQPLGKAEASVTVYLDGQVILSAIGVEFAEAPKESRLGVIVPPTQPAMGRFTFRPLY